MTTLSPERPSHIQTLANTSYFVQRREITTTSLLLHVAPSLSIEVLMLQYKSFKILILLSYKQPRQTIESLFFRISNYLSILSNSSSTTIWNYSGRFYCDIQPGTVASQIPATNCIMQCPCVSD